MMCSACLAWRSLSFWQRFPSRQLSAAGRSRRGQKRSWSAPMKSPLWRRSRPVFIKNLRRGGAWDQEPADVPQIYHYLSDRQRGIAGVSSGGGGLCRPGGGAGGDAGCGQRVVLWLCSGGRDVTKKKMADRKRSAIFLFPCRYGIPCPRLSQNARMRSRSSGVSQSHSSSSRRASTRKMGGSRSRTAAIPPRSPVRAARLGK